MSEALDLLKCRCHGYVGDPCSNGATQEDGLCDWCRAMGVAHDVELCEQVPLGEHPHLTDLVHDEPPSWLAIA